MKKRLIRQGISYIALNLFSLLSCYKPVEASPALWTGTVAMGAESRGVVSNPLNDRIYAISGDTVRVYNSNLSLVGSYGSTGSANGQFTTPSGIGVHPITGDVYVSELGTDRIQIFNSSMTYITQIGTTNSPGNSATRLNNPTQMCYNQFDGYMYATDYFNHTVKVYDTSNLASIVYRGSFVSSGAGNGQANQVPSAVVHPISQQIYVTDLGGARIQIFNGTSPWAWSGGGTIGSAGAGDGQFTAPFGIRFHSDTANLYVCDKNNHRLQVFDNTNAFRYKLGTFGSGTGNFSGLQYVDVEPKTGRILIGDAGNSRIVVLFEPTAWTQPGTSYLHSLPLDQSLTLNTGYNLAVNVNAGTSKTTLGAGSTLTLNGGTFATGLLDINTGILRVQSGLYNIAAPTALVGAAGNTFQIDAGTTLTMSGIISQSGGVRGFTKSGTGTLILTNNNTFAGGVTHNAGTMQIGHTNALGSGSVTMDNGAILQAGFAVTNTNDISIANAAAVNLETQAFAWTLSGAITGNGTTSFTKTGTGTLTLSGINGGFTGEATVSTGTLAINNAFGGSVVVNGGAILKGTGAITGDVTGSGTVAPGQSPGIMNVGGNYTPGAGSTLLIAMQPDSNPPVAGTDYSQLVVTGNATLSNTTLALDGNNGAYTQGAQYTILSAGSVVGTFINTSATIGSYRGTISYTPTSAILTLGLTPVASHGGGAAGSTGDYINSLPAAPGSDLEGVVKTINVLPSFQQEQILDSINPSANSQMMQANIENTPKINNIAQIRLSTLRDYTGGTISAAPAALKSADSTLFNMLNGCEGSASTLTLGALEASARDSLNSQLQGSKGMGGVWVHSFGQLLYQDATVNQSAYRGKVGGVLAGLDYKVNDKVVMGGGLGITQSLLKRENDGGNSRIRAYYGTIYGSYSQNDWHLDGSLTTAFNVFKTTRRIMLPLETRLACSTHNGMELTPHMDIGYNVHLIPRSILEPFISVDYVMQREKGYSETGANSLNHHIKGKSSSLLRSEAGLNLRHNFDWDSNKVAVRGKLSYVHKKGWKTDKLTANFVGRDQGFMIEGSQGTRQQISPGIEVEVNTERNQYWLLRYNGEYDRRTKSHEVMLKIGKKF